MGAAVHTQNESLLIEDGKAAETKRKKKYLEIAIGCCVDFFFNDNIDLDFAAVTGPAKYFREDVENARTFFFIRHPIPSHVCWSFINYGYAGVER